MSEGLHLENEDKAGGLPKIVQRYVMFAWASLSAERFWPLLWPAGGIVAVALPQGAGDARIDTIRVSAGDIVAEGDVLAIWPPIAGG